MAQIHSTSLGFFASLPKRKFSISSERKILNCPFDRKMIVYFIWSLYFSFFVNIVTKIGATKKSILLRLKLIFFSSLFVLLSMTNCFVSLILKFFFLHKEIRWVHKQKVLSYSWEGQRSYFWEWIYPLQNNRRQSRITWHRFLTHVAASFHSPITRFFSNSFPPTSNKIKKLGWREKEREKGNGSLTKWSEFDYRSIQSFEPLKCLP